MTGITFGPILECLLKTQRVVFSKVLWLEEHEQLSLIRAVQEWLGLLLVKNTRVYELIAHLTLSMKCLIADSNPVASPSRRV